MASELRFLGGNLLFDNDKLAMDAGCCCCDCDAPGGSPAAAFSYEQTGDDPCELNLTDESSDGNCAPITSWRWLKNGVQFSTSQNPTGVSYADGDDITLEVTDSAGCTDSAVMEVRCYEYCCGCPIPDEVQLNFSGCTFPASDPAQRCHCLDGLSNAVDVTMTRSVSDCEKTVNRTGNPYFGGNGVPYNCNGSPAYESFTAILRITCAGGIRTIELILDPDWLATGSEMYFRRTEPDTDDCDGGWDLPWHHSGGANIPYCSVNCTAEIRW